MNVNVDNVIVGTALILGAVQMFESLRRVDTMNEQSVRDLILGAAASFLWLIHQTRKGANFSALYSGLALLLQLYLLSTVLHRVEPLRRADED